MAIADRVHAGYPEDRAVFVERLTLFPRGCRIAQAVGAGNAGAAIGYAVMHPGRLGAPPALDSLLGVLPAEPDCLYIHDVALLPDARGMGFGAGALIHARALAKDLGIETLALSSTPEGLGYWVRLGFTPYGAGDAALAGKLASYGGGMTYMTLPA
jgi:GNAT superfamily N-acetyltransferase